MPTADTDREIQIFLNGVVHDLRAAQRAIGISAEILRSAAPEGVGQSVDSTLQRLLEGVAKMNALLSGISAYSMSLPIGKYSFGQFPSDIALHAALANLEREILDTEATITHTELPEVVADRERLTWVFRNLIDNALKYRGAESPRIHLQAKRNSDSWVFSVADNGIGIDPKYWSELFVPFHRLHGSDIPGIGLSLVICKKIVEAHHGRIWLESVVGTGTTFFFTLPTEMPTRSDGP